MAFLGKLEGFILPEHDLYFLEIGCFDPFLVEQTLSKEPAVYVFIRNTQVLKPAEVIYVGETGDLSTRFNSHHKMPCIEEHKATHLGLILSEAMEDKSVREVIEIDLIERHEPRCNDPRNP